MSDSSPHGGSDHDAQGRDADIRYLDDYMSAVIITSAALTMPLFVGFTGWMIYSGVWRLRISGSININQALLAIALGWGALLYMALRDVYGKRRMRELIALIEENR